MDKHLSPMQAAQRSAIRTPGEALAVDSLRTNEEGEARSQNIEIDHRKGALRCVDGDRTGKSRNFRLESKAKQRELSFYASAAAATVAICHSVAIEPANDDKNGTDVRRKNAAEENKKQQQQQEAITMAFAQSIRSPECGV